jgi:Mn-dependent DtxR family transcriptional regulator
MSTQNTSTDNKRTPIAENDVKATLRLAKNCLYESGIVVKLATYERHAKNQVEKFSAETSEAYIDGLKKFLAFMDKVHAGKSKTSDIFATYEDLNKALKSA